MHRGREVRVAIEGRALKPGAELLIAPCRNERVNWTFLRLHVNPQREAILEQLLQHQVDARRRAVWTVEESAQVDDP